MNNNLLDWLMYNYISRVLLLGWIQTSIIIKKLTIFKRGELWLLLPWFLHSRQEGHRVNTIWAVICIQHELWTLIKCWVVTTSSSLTWHNRDIWMVMGLFWIRRGIQDYLTLFLKGIPQETIAFPIHGNRKCINLGIGIILICVLHSLFFYSLRYQFFYWYIIHH